MGKNIVIVSSNYKAITENLESTFFPEDKIISLSKGKQALEEIIILSKHSSQLNSLLVHCGFELSDMEGYDFSRYIREKQQTSKTKVISAEPFISGKTKYLNQVFNINIQDIMNQMRFYLEKKIDETGDWKMIKDNISSEEEVRLLIKKENQNRRSMPHIISESSHAKEYEDRKIGSLKRHNGHFVTIYGLDNSIYAKIQKTFNALS
jgi:hypothetical protein